MGLRDEQSPESLNIGGNWQLLDLEGRKYSSDMLRGHYYLIYFGSSLCPDVCPLTLNKICKARRIINRSNEGKQYIKVKSVFVTTNPEYDTAERLRKYRDTMFDKDLVVLRSESNTSQ